MMGPLFPLSVALTLTLAAPAAEPIVWPGFRGPEGLGAAAGEAAYPVQFGPTKNVEWKTALPAGNSCPCIWGDRVFVTGFDKDKKQIETICLDRKTGGIRWRKPTIVEKLESSEHPANGSATPTAATDGERVYAYFGSFGMLAYDMEGREVWRRPLPMPQVMFGSGSSPIVAGSLVILAYPGKQSALIAFDCRTGNTVWKRDQPRFRIGYATPVPRKLGSETEILVCQARGIVAYDLKDGSERWWSGGLFGGGIPSPAFEGDLVFVVAHFPGGDPDDPMRLPDFDGILKKYDADKDGKLSQKELPMDLILYNRGGGSTDPRDHITVEDLYGILDRNQDKQIERDEWQKASADLLRRESSMVAIRPDGKGDQGSTHIAWKEKRALPEVPSPLCYQGRLYLVKDGGIVTCLEPKTGKLIYRNRLGASGLYYASPVAGGGRVYAASRDGVVVVFEAGDAGKVLAKNDVAEPIVATPALADGRLYVRTEGHLFAFRENGASRPGKNGW